MDKQRNNVPVRTVAVGIGMLLVSAAAVWLVMEIRRVLVWLAVSGFFAIVLAPLVGVLQRRARLPRALAALLAMIGVVAAIAGIIAVLVRPLIEAIQPFIQRLPGYIQQAQNGRGPIADVLQRFNVVQRVQQNLDSIQGAVQRLADPAFSAVLTAGSLVVGIVVVLVLTFLLVLDGPKLVEHGVGLLPERQRDRAHRVLRESGRAVTGYVGGQLLIGTLCGGVTYVVLAILGVPFRNVVAVFVGIVDLIPVVGATIGGSLAVGVSFLHSIPAGIVMLVFFLVYQQLENHLLQPFIQARTVHLNALAVLVSVLIGVELAGILGALLAIPAAGMLQVVLRDLWTHRRGRLAVSQAGAADDAPTGGAATSQPAAGQQASAVPGNGGRAKSGEGLAAVDYAAGTAGSGDGSHPAESSPRRVPADKDSKQPHLYPP